MTSAVRFDPEQGLVRAVRAAVLTVPAVGAAAIAHASAGGCTSVMGTVMAAGLCWPAAVALLGARRRLPALVGWLLLAQALTHLLLERLCSDVMSGQMGLLDHLTMGLTPAMLGLHAGSVVVTAVLFGRADAGLWVAAALVRAGARLLRLATALPVPTSFVTPRPALPMPVVQVVQDIWKAPYPVRRGPPALLAR